MVRIDEMRESISIIRDCFKKMPAGPTMASKVPVRATGEAFRRTEVLTSSSQQAIRYFSRLMMAVMIMFTYLTVQQMEQ